MALASRSEIHARLPIIGRPMPRLTVFAFAMLLSMAAAAQDEPGLQIWITPGMISDHGNEERDYNEKNTGFGVEAFITPRHGLIAGRFENSNYEQSRYLGYHWRPLQIPLGPLRLSGGVALALIDGYSDVNDGGTFPSILPSVSAEFWRLGAHLIYVPNPEHSGAVALLLRFRLW
jgi:hypothetical protein